MKLPDHPLTDANGRQTSLSLVVAKGVTVRAHVYRGLRKTDWLKAYIGVGGGEYEQICDLEIDPNLSNWRIERIVKEYYLNWKENHDGHSS